MSVFWPLSVLCGHGGDGGGGGGGGGGGDVSGDCGDAVFHL